MVSVGWIVHYFLGYNGNEFIPFGFHCALVKDAGPERFSIQCLACCLYFLKHLHLVSKLFYLSPQLLRKPILLAA